MTEPFIGEIKIFAGNFAPRGYAFCDGQWLAIKQNTTLFSILGTTYGGDGRTTFALPDLRGRFPMHPGSGQGLTSRTAGDKGGEEQIHLSQAKLPASKKPGATIYTGANHEENNLPPFLCLNFIIAIQGIFPSRN